MSFFSAFLYRRMFPSMRMALSGLESDQNYCVLLEMAPIADCRYKFSGSQWVPAGGAEPQSPQNIYIHPDSPALGSHWQAQPILFNKVKLTNNTLDSNGHVSIFITIWNTENGGNYISLCTYLGNSVDFWSSHPCNFLFSWREIWIFLFHSSHPWLSEKAWRTKYLNFPPKNTELQGSEN